MEKETVKRIIAEKHIQIANTKLVKRPAEFEPEANYVFVGLRRAGKSYTMYQLIQEQLEAGQASMESILFINFEDERIAHIKAEELGLLLDAHSEMFDARPAIFLDEIQNVVGWEKFARRLADARYRVFITGSNAKMLAKDIYTTLGGRYMACNIYPFSFREYLAFHSVVLGKNWEYTEQRTQVTRLFSDYFYYGGLAESFGMKDKREWLNSLYQKIILGDIIARNGIRNENPIRVLAKKIAESVLTPSSLARLKHVVDSTGTTIARNTLVEYLQFLSDAFLIFGISGYSDKLSSKETFKKRYYFDNGLLNNFLIAPEPKLLENLVAITLKKRYGDNLFYYSKNVEVDFFIPEHRRAVQASYSIAANDTGQREVRALLKLAEVYTLDSLEIVTFNEDGTIRENGRTIAVTPIWKWLLKEE